MAHWGLLRPPQKRKKQERKKERKKERKNENIALLSLNLGTRWK
jgi:hypothetical protein